MKGLLKGLQSILIAMVLLCMIGTGIILWFNNKGDDTEIASQPETETITEQGTAETEAAFPDAIPLNTVLMETEEQTEADSSGTTTHKHTYKPTIIKDPTCTSVGQMRYQCSCGDFYIEPIATLEHRSGDWVTLREATTTAAGLKQQRCTRCGSILKEEIIPMLKPSADDKDKDKDKNKDKNKKEDENHIHSYIGAITTPPTCTTDGIMTYTCTCDSSYTTPIPATGHPSRQTVVTEATCTEPGTIICSCAECKAVLSQDSMLPLGHSFGKWELTTPPTKTAVGKWTRTCIRCEEKEEQEIPKTTDPASNHKHFYVMNVTKAPSCTQDGTYTYTCSCSESYTENVKAYGHAPSNWIIITPPTENSNGQRQKICRRCGEVVADEVIVYQPVHKHDYTETVYKAPTCTRIGYTTRMCKDCGASFTTQIDMIPHRFVTNADGSRTCADCGMEDPNFLPTP